MQSLAPNSSNTLASKFIVNLKTFAVPEITPLPLNRLLFKGTAIYSGVQNHSGH